MRGWNGEKGAKVAQARGTRAQVSPEVVQVVCGMGWTVVCQVGKIVERTLSRMLVDNCQSEKQEVAAGEIIRERERGPH